MADAAALHLLGVIAARAREFDKAADYLDRALAAEPRQQPDRAEPGGGARRTAAVPAGRSALPADPEWGFDFWADVSHLLGTLLLAEATGRIPVTWWGGGGLFSDGEEHDAFQFYFQPVSDIALRDLPDAGFFPPRWNKANLTQSGSGSLQLRSKWVGKGSRAGAVYFLNRPEAVAVSDFHIAVINVMPWLPPAHPMHGKPLDTVCRYLAEKYLHPQADIVAACDAFFDAHLAGHPSWRCICAAPTKAWKMRMPAPPPGRSCPWRRKATPARASWY